MISNNGLLNMVQGEFIRQLHKQKWSGNQIAYALRVTPACVSFVLNNKRCTRLKPGPVIINQVAHSIKVDSNYCVAVFMICAFVAGGE